MSRRLGRQRRSPGPHEVRRIAAEAAKAPGVREFIHARGYEFSDLPLLVLFGLGRAEAGQGRSKGRAKSSSSPHRDALVRAPRLDVRQT